MSVSAFIGLGSNLDTPLEHVEQACQQMNELADTRLVQHSPWYRSQAVGPTLFTLGRADIRFRFAVVRRPRH